MDKVLTTLWQATNDPETADFTEWVRSCLGTFAKDFHVPDLAWTYRKLINNGLPDGLSLLGNGDVYGEFSGDAAEKLRTVIDRIPFWTLAQQYEKETQ